MENCASADFTDAADFLPSAPLGGNRPHRRARAMGRREKKRIRRLRRLRRFKTRRIHRFHRCRRFLAMRPVRRKSAAPPRSRDGSPGKKAHPQITQIAQIQKTAHPQISPIHTDFSPSGPLGGNRRLVSCGISPRHRRSCAFAEVRSGRPWGHGRPRNHETENPCESVQSVEAVFL